LAETRAVFFDLDDTLIEFPGGFGGLLKRVYALAVAAGAPEALYDCFRRCFWSASIGAWAAMHAGTLSGDEVRRQRIVRALAAVRLSDPGLAGDMLRLWDELNVELPSLRPGATELLNITGSRAYIGVITDGFLTLQRRKLDRFCLWPYFRAVHISEEVGVCKPFRGIFQRALECAAVQPEQAVMVGDNVNCDIRGALGVGMGAIHLVSPETDAATPHGASRATSLWQVAEVLQLRLRPSPVPEN